MNVIYVILHVIDYQEKELECNTLYHSIQESKGIRQWSINWCISSIMIHKIIPSVDYHYMLKRLDTQLTKPTNQNLISPPTLLSQGIRRHYYNTWVLV